jgi:hypothetical protein
MPAPRSRPEIISVREISERLGVDRTTVYVRAQQTGYVYPGVPVTRIEGSKRVYVSRAAFERAIGKAQELTLDEIPVDWWDR